MSNLRIRQATIADLDAIERNVNAVCREGIYLVPSRFVTPQHWRKILAAGGELDNDLIAMAEVDGRIVVHGRMFATAGTSAHVVDLGMVVIAELHDRGIGSQIISYMLDWARHKRGCAKSCWRSSPATNGLSTSTRSSASPSRGCLAQQHRIGGQYVDEILMVRLLKQCSDSPAQSTATWN